MEIWKFINGYEGFYEVSNLGNVRSTPRPYTKGGILKGYEMHGYLRVILCVDGKTKSKSIHRLVAETFIENPQSYDIINHKDENKTNNNVNNLEWCTQSYNVQYSRNTGGILQIDTDGSIVAIWESALEAERKKGFDNSAIIKCCKDKRKTHKGFTWKYNIQISNL